MSIQLQILRRQILACLLMKKNHRSINYQDKAKVKKDEGEKKINSLHRIRLIKKIKK